MRRTLVVAAALGLALAGSAAAQTASDAFERAVDDISDHPRRAAAALVEVADQAPDDPLADDALFQAGQLYEETLADPAKAAALYRRLVETYPDSRLATAADARLAELQPHLGGGDDRVLAAFLAIKSARAELGRDEAIRRAQTLLDQNPTWSGAGALALWLGGEYERATRWQDAAKAYGVARAQSTDPQAAFDASLRAARLSIHRGEFDDAEAILNDIQAPDLDRRRAVAEARAALDSARGRATLSIAALVVAIAAVVALIASLRVGAGSWAQAGRALVSPPTEALFLGPVCLLLVAVSATGFPEIARAVAAICAGGLAVTWISGAGLRSGRRKRVIALHALATGAAIACICYIALYRASLLDLIAQTVQFGPEL